MDEVLEVFLKLCYRFSREKILVHYELYKKSNIGRHKKFWRKKIRESNLNLLNPLYFASCTFSFHFCNFHDLNINRCVMVVVVNRHPIKPRMGTGPNAHFRALLYNFKKLHFFDELKHIM